MLMNVLIIILILGGINQVYLIYLLYLAKSYKQERDQFRQLAKDQEIVIQQMSSLVLKKSCTNPMDQ